MDGWKQLHWDVVTASLVVIRNISDEEGQDLTKLPIAELVVALEEIGLLQTVGNRCRQLQNLTPRQLDSSGS